MSERMRYDYNALRKFCNENNIELLEDYSKIIVKLHTTIKGKCTKTDCENNFDKRFRNLIKSNSYFCSTCSKIVRYEKAIQTCLKNHGVPYYLQSKKIRDLSKQKYEDKYNVNQIEEIQNKRKQTNLKNNGVEYPFQSKDIREKSKQTNLKNRGVENPSQSEDIKNKKIETCLKNHGVEHPSQSEVIRNKQKETCFNNHGVENPMQNEDIREKGKQTCLKNHGVENPSQSEEIHNKKLETCLKNHGVKYYLQSEEGKDKIIQTNIVRFGVQHPYQNKDIREKGEQTCLKNHGVKYASQNEEIKKKMKKTNIVKFGVPYASQSEEIQKKTIKTNRERYGCERPLQNSDIMEKMSKNSYKLKDYTFPSGNQIKYQGYEHYALDELLKEGILEEEIINGCKNVPEVWFEDEQGKEHRYYVDIFIPSQKRCIEVKSTWTAEKKKDCIFLKQHALKEAGYACEIWVYNGKGEKVECYK